MYTIYKYTNINNGKVYIGQTSKTLAERAQSLGRNYRECRRFYNAIKKYSWDAFVPEVIEQVETVEEANELEAFYISFYDSTDERFGYNIAVGGSNSVMSDETRAIISEKAKERYTDITANPMYGKKHNEVSIALQSAKKMGANNPMFGTRWTATQRERSGTRGKKLNLSDDHRAALSAHARRIGETTGLRAVVCVEDELSFDSIKDAANHYGVSKSTLCGHLRGSQKTCCGKHFKYKN